MTWKENVILKIGTHPMNRYAERFLGLGSACNLSIRARRYIWFEIERQIKDSFILTTGQLKRMKIRRKRRKENGKTYYLAHVKRRRGQLFVNRIYVVGFKRLIGTSSYTLIVYTVFPPRVQKIKNVRGGAFIQKIDVRRDN